MKKLLIGFACGALFFSGVSYAASGKLTASIANYKLVINGKEKALKNKPVIINGTTYLPLRETSEAVGYNVALKNGQILLDNGSAASNQSASGTTSNTTKNNYTMLDELVELKLNVNGKYYGLAAGSRLYMSGNTIYCQFDASQVDLIVSIASNDYKVYETGNDNPDFITADHFASSYKYLEIIEKQKSYKLNNIKNGKSYEILLDKNSSKGVTYLEDSNKYLVPINDVFKSLDLNMEAKYEADQKRVVLKFK